MKFSIRDEPPACPDDREIDLLSGTIFPDPSAAGQLGQRGIDKNLSVAAFNDRRFLGRAERLENLLALLGFRVEPGKRYKVLVKKLANRVRVTTPPWADDS